MKKLFPIALLLCVTFSLSGLAQEHQISPAATTKQAFAPSFPLSGQTWGRLGVGQPYGLIDYTIPGAGFTPYSVTLYNHATGVQIGSTYWFTGGPTAYYAQGMVTDTGIDAFEFIVSSSLPDGWRLTIIAP